MEESHLLFYGTYAFLSMKKKNTLTLHGAGTGRPFKNANNLVLQQDP